MSFPEQPIASRRICKALILNLEFTGEDKELAELLEYGGFQVVQKPCTSKTRMEILEEDFTVIIFNAHGAEVEGMVREFGR